MTEALAGVAPGRPLREGLDRILQANMGALIVVGDGPEVLAICSGGFLLDAEFTPQRLSELGKMDGAIILASDSSRIARANVHLVPNPHVPTSETGTRHRTAERVARSIPVPVISVSEDMSIIAVYVGGLNHPLEPYPRLLNHADKALQPRGRDKNRLAIPPPSSSALCSASAICRRSCAPPSTTSTTSRASAAPGPGPSRTVSRVSPRRASSTATPENFALASGACSAS